MRREKPPLFMLSSYIIGRASYKRLRYATPSSTAKNSEHDPVARVTQVHHHHPGRLSAAGEG